MISNTTPLEFTSSDAQLAELQEEINKNKRELDRIQKLQNATAVGIQETKVAIERDAEKFQADLDKVGRDIKRTKKEIRSLQKHLVITTLFLIIVLGGALLYRYYCNSSHR